MKEIGNGHDPAKGSYSLERVRREALELAEKNRSKTSSPPQPRDLTNVRSVQQPATPPSPTPAPRPNATTAPKGAPTNSRPSKKPPVKKASSGRWWRVMAGVLAVIALLAIGGGMTYWLMDKADATPQVPGTPEQSASQGTYEFTCKAPGGKQAFARQSPGNKHQFGPDYDTANIKIGEVVDRLQLKLPCDVSFMAAMEEYRVNKGKFNPSDAEELAREMRDNEDYWKSVFENYNRLLVGYDLRNNPDVKYASLGMIIDPNAPAGTLPTFTQFGDHPTLGWTLVLKFDNNGDGIVDDELPVRIICDLQPALPEFELVSTPPPSGTPPGTQTSTPPPPGTTIVTPPPPPPPGGCTEGCVTPPPPPPVCTCEHPCGPPPPECQPCPNGLCKDYGNGPESVLPPDIIRQPLPALPDHQESDGPEAGLPPAVYEPPADVPVWTPPDSGGPSVDPAPQPAPPAETGTDAVTGQPGHAGSGAPGTPSSGNGANGANEGDTGGF